MWLFSTRCSRLLIAILLLTIPTMAQDNVSAKRPFGQHTTTFSATPTFDAGVTQNWKMTLTGNVTGSTLIGAEAGMTLTWEICQDGTGSRTFVWPSQIVNPIAIPSAANACITEPFQFDGTNANMITTSSGGSGSGTVSPGTVKQMAIYTGSTVVSSDSLLDDNLLNANALTYNGSGGIFAALYSVTGSGAMTFIGNNGTCSGATVGKTVLCLGDSVSATAQISNSGDSFRSAATQQSTSPTAHGIMLSETFPQIFAAPRGTQGQPFCEGASAADPGFCQLDLSLSTNVINRLAKANMFSSTMFNDQVNTMTAAGTIDLSASTVASAFRTPIGAGLTCILNGAHCYDSTNNNIHVGVNAADHISAIWAGTLPANNDCIKATVVSSHIELASAGTGPCGSGGTPRLDQILSATNAWTTTNGDNPLSLQFAATTSGRTAFELTESAAATSGGTPFLLNVHTLAASTFYPCQFTARGTVNGIRCDVATGSLSAIGTANINSTQINGVNISGTPGVGQIPVATSGTAASWGDPSTANIVTQASNAANGQVCTYTAANRICVPATALPNGITATSQAAGDNTANVATDAFVNSAVTNAINGSNPAVAVQVATITFLPTSPVYSNGVSGIGATITAGSNNTTLVVDGYTPALNDRILVKNESGGLGASRNGVYTVTQLAAIGLPWILTRALDYDQPSDMNNTGAIPVVNGTVNTDTSWFQTSQITTVGTDAVTFTQFSLNPTTLPFRVGASDVTAQGSSQSAVTLATSPTSGRYVITYYADQNGTCTTGANSVSFTFNWTDASNARVLNTGSLSLGSAQSTSGYLSGEIPLFVGSGNVTYSSTVNGSCATGSSTYDVHVNLERKQ